MDDSGELLLACTIEKIILPRLFPSMVNIRWKHGHKKGKTSFFRANNRNIEVQHKFNFSTPRPPKHPMHLYLFMKAVTGAITKIGETQFTIPPIYDIQQGFNGTSEIDTQMGKFAIQYSITNVQIDENDVEAHEFLEQMKTLGAFDRYVDTIKNLHPINFDTFDVSPVWGENGVFSDARTVAHINPDEINMDTLKELTGILENTAFQTANVAVLVSNVLRCFTGIKPLYITDNGKVDAPKFATEHVSPVAGVLIGQALEKMRPDDIETMTLALVDICSAIAAFIEQEDATEPWIVYTIATCFFVVSFLTSRGLYSLENARMAFDVIGRNAVTTFIKRTVAAILRIHGNPAQVASYLANQKKVFDLSFLGPSIWPAFTQHFLARLDHVVVHSWLVGASAEVGHLGEYERCFPEYSFPLIAALQICVSGIDKIVSGRTPLKKVPAPFQCCWLSMLVDKAIQHGRKLAPKKVAALKAQVGVDNAPEIPRDDRFINDWDHFADEMPPVPSVLPTVPVEKPDCI